MKLEIEEKLSAKAVGTHLRRIDFGFFRQVRCNTKRLRIDQDGGVHESHREVAFVLIAINEQEVTFGCRMTQREKLGCDRLRDHAPQTRRFFIRLYY
jgi:hypothetical protein